MKSLVGSVELREDSDLKALSRSSIFGSLILIALFIFIALLGFKIPLFFLTLNSVVFIGVSILYFYTPQKIKHFKSCYWSYTIFALIYISTLVYLTGGISSPVVWVYLVYVAMEMLWVSVEKGKLVALLALLSLNSLMLLQYFKILNQKYFITGVNPYSSYPYMIAFITGYMGYFVAVTILVAMLAQKLTEGRDSLKSAKEESDKKAAELQYFYEISKKTTILKNIDSLTDFFIKQIAKVLDAKKCSLYLRDEEGFELKKSFGYRAKKRLEIEDEFLENIKALEPQHYGKEGKINKLLGLSGWLLFFPLRGDQKLLGFIIAQASEEKMFEKEKIDLVDALVPQITAVIHNSLLFKGAVEDQTQAKKTALYLKKSRTAVLNILEDISILNARLEKAIAQTKSMYRIAIDISRSIEQEKLLDSILSNALKLINAESGIIMLKQKAQLLPFKEKNFNLEAELKVFPGMKSFEQGKAIISNNIKNDFKDFSNTYPSINNSIAVPFIQNERVLGCICLFNKKSDINENDRKLLVTLANQATISLLNAQIFEREKETVKKLKEIDKLKDDFVASISHELKSPLTSIKGYLEILLEGEAGTLSKQQNDFLSIIDQSSDRLYHLITDLLDFAKIESNSLHLNKGNSSMPIILKKSIALLKVEMDKKHLKLITNIKNNLPEINVDKNRIEQVILNLLTNAIKFSNDEGKIDVDCWKENGSVIASVTDTGMGISEAEQKNLFKKFYRSQNAVKRGTPGTGLGLAICKGIVEQHGGKIWVKSKSDEGSTFYFSLPIK